MKRLLPLLLALAAGNAAAATFEVDSYFDDPDQVPGDGACDSTRGTSCTLRAAIQEANALDGQDTIAFALGEATIVPLSPLPTISDDLVIDGTTSPAYAPAGELPLQAPPAVFLDGTFLAGASDDGLSAAGTASNRIRLQVRGLGIVNFPRYGIDVTFGDLAWIEANWIGIARAATGTSSGNGSHGILLSACEGCIVGSTIFGLFGAVDVIGRGNAIGNNGGDGVLSGLGSGTRIGGNEIGVMPGSTPGTYTSGGNAGRGISLLDAGARVGESLETDDGLLRTRNFIHFNGGDGVYTGGADSRVEFANVMLNGGNGVTLQGDDSLLRNSAIRSNGSHGVQVGGAAAADRATVESCDVSGNDGRGIYLQAGTGALLTANVVYRNDNDGVRVDGDANVVRGNRIGVFSTNTLGGNAFNGIVVAGSDNDILDNEVLDTAGDGIDVGGQRTTVSGNLVGVTRFGVAGGNTTGIRVQPGALVADLLGNTVVASSGDGMVLEAPGVLACGNFVGQLADGTAAGNGIEGIRLLGDDGFIGRYPPAPAFCAGGGNRIANNASDGLQVHGSGNLIAENLLLSQGRGGVLLADAAAGNVLVDNLLAGNGDAAVRIGATTGAGNRVAENGFIVGADIPVDLGDDGATANDPGDADTGPNRLMNHPDLVAVFSGTGQVDVSYRVDIAAANASFPLELTFFLVTTEAGTSSYEPIGTDVFDAPPLTQQTVTLSLPAGVDGGAIAALVTDSAGSSSEIGPGMAFTAIPLGPALFADGFED